MKVLGLDPGSRTLGYGLLESDGANGRRIAGGTLRLDPRRSLVTRLEQAYSGVRSILATHRPDLVVIEECFVAQSPKAALVLGQVRGVLLLAVEQEKLPVLEYSPRAVKLAAVGRGGAAKEQVQYMISRVLSDCPSSLDPDEADALAVAWCGLTHALSPVPPGRGTARRLP